MSRVALRLGRVINQHTDDDVGVVVRGADLDDLRTVVLLPLTANHAQDLAGLLLHADVVTVGQERISSAQLVDQPEVPVDPGPVVVRVDLPWGQ